MKKLLSAIFFTGILISALTGSGYAWDDCPYGKEDDEYPGDCPRYVDTDGDGICDRSQPAPEDRDDGTDVDSVSDSEDYEASQEDCNESISGQVLKTMNISEIADEWGVSDEELLFEIETLFELEGDYTVSSVLDTLRTEYPFSPEQIRNIADVLAGNEVDTGLLADTDSGDQDYETATGRTSPYNVAVPFLSAVFLYGIGWYLSRKPISKKYRLLSRPLFDLIWNTVLVLSSIPSVIFGFYLVMRYSIPSLQDVNFDFLYWHVEGSIVFGTVAVMHLLSRLGQYVAPINLLRRRS